MRKQRKNSRKSFSSPIMYLCLAFLFWELFFPLIPLDNIMLQLNFRLYSVVSLRAWDIVCYIAL